MYPLSLCNVICFLSGELFEQVANEGIMQRGKGPFDRVCCRIVFVSPQRHHLSLILETIPL
jgi:hypothetical protein